MFYESTFFRERHYGTNSLYFRYIRGKVLYIKSLFRLAFTVISAGVVLLAGGCSEKTGGGDLIWDIAPFSVTFRVINAQGEDLLNPETPENILENGITATYDGKVYELNADKVDYYPDTKAIMPVFQGLHTVYILHSRFLTTSASENSAAIRIGKGQT